MEPTLAQIRAFERIVRLGSFHAAAGQLGLTQPSVSQRIRDLEETLGVQLFIRRGPTTNLTAAGTALIAYADRLLDTTSEMLERFRERDPLKGVLRLGLNESFGLLCLTDLLRRLEESHPNLKTSVQVGDTATVSALLNERQLDVAVVSEPVLDDHIAREPLGTNELGWFAGSDFDAPQRVLSPVDLCSYHLVITPPPARLHTTAWRWFGSTGAVPTRLSMCNSLSVTIQAIENNLGVGLVPVGVMRDAVSRGTARRLLVSPPVPGHNVWICHQLTDSGPSMQALTRLVRDVAMEHQAFI